MHDFWPDRLYLVVFNSVNGLSRVLDVGSVRHPDRKIRWQGRHIVARNVAGQQAHVQVHNLQSKAFQELHVPVYDGLAGFWWSTPVQDFDELMFACCPDRATANSFIERWSSMGDQLLSR